jgi:hypothetical protein
MVYVTAVVEPEGVRIRGTYHGGEYIELHWGGTKWEPGATFEVINVWDHETDQARIGSTRDDLLAELKRWVASNRDTERAEGGPGFEWLDNYLRNTLGGRVWGRV